jgi:uncharacterized protein (TIGR03067 family)
MDRRSFLGGVAALAVAAFAQADDAAKSPQAMDRLIQQLGSKRFREREAACKALERVGESALDALHEAATGEPDPEVRRRATGLVERIEAQVKARAYRALQGTWVVVPLEFNGQPNDEPWTRHVTFAGRRFTVARQPDGYTGTVELKPFRRPPELCLVWGPDEETSRQLIRGIYRWKGAELQICLSGARRPVPPKTFKTHAGTGQTLDAYRLVQPARR